MLTDSTTFDWAIYSIAFVFGENYDVNGDPTDGPELHDNPQGNHVQSDATDLGTAANGLFFNSFQGQILSDGRPHQNPSIVGFDAVTGSAPDWFTTFVPTSLFEQNQVTARITTWGGSSLSLYKLVIMTNKGTFSATVSGAGTVMLSTGQSSFTDESTVYFEIQKVGGPHEAVGYAVTYEVHNLGVAFPADPTFTNSVITSSARAWFYGEPQTFTANVSASGVAAPTGAVQFQIDGANVGQPVALGPYGYAAFTTTTLAPGRHRVSAVYISDSSTVQGSGSANLAGLVTVTAAPLDDRCQRREQELRRHPLQPRRAPASSLPSAWSTPTASPASRWSSRRLRGRGERGWLALRHRLQRRRGQRPGQLRHQLR